MTGTAANVQSFAHGRMQRIAVPTKIQIRAAVRIQAARSSVQTCVKKSIATVAGTATTIRAFAYAMRHKHAARGRPKPSFIQTCPPESTATAPEIVMDIQSFAHVQKHKSAVQTI